MTDPTPDLTAAARIVADELRAINPLWHCGRIAGRVVAALARGGWLHDPGERRRWHVAQIALAERAARMETEVAATLGELGEAHRQLEAERDRWDAAQAEIADLRTALRHSRGSYL